MRYSGRGSFFALTRETSVMTRRNFTNGVGCPQPSLPEFAGRVPDEASSINRRTARQLGDRKFIRDLCLDISEFRATHADVIRSARVNRTCVLDEAP
jgi:hypothetical protein